MTEAKPEPTAAKKIEPKVQCWFTTLPQSWFGEAPPPKEHGPPAKAELELLLGLVRNLDEARLRHRLRLNCFARSSDDCGARRNTTSGKSDARQRASR